MKLGEQNFGVKENVLCPTKYVQMKCGGVEQCLFSMVFFSCQSN